MKAWIRGGGSSSSQDPAAEDVRQRPLSQLLQAELALAHEPGAVKTDDVKEGRVLGLAGNLVHGCHGAAKSEMQVRLACRI